jgi:hypothetical protein
MAIKRGEGQKGWMESKKPPWIFVGTGTKAWCVLVCVDPEFLWIRILQLRGHLCDCILWDHSRLS